MLGTDHYSFDSLVWGHLPLVKVYTACGNCWTKRTSTQLQSWKTTKWSAMCRYHIPDTSVNFCKYVPAPYLARLPEKGWIEVEDTAWKCPANMWLKGACWLWIGWENASRAKGQYWTVLFSETRKRERKMLQKMLLSPKSKSIIEWLNY